MSFSSFLQARYNRWSSLLLIAFASFQVYFGLIPGWTSIRSDFPNYYVSSRLIIEHQNDIQLYNNSWFQDQIYKHQMDSPGKFAPFPPPTAFILLPISGLTPLKAKRCWLIINVGFLFLLSRLISKICEFDFKGSLLLILSTGIALANTMMLGQMYILLLLSMLWAYHLLVAKKSSLPGMILGAGIAVKYFPAVFIPSLIHAKRWKSLLVLSLSILVLNTAALFVFGWKNYADFFQTVFFQHLDGNLEGQSPWSYAFQSWNALAHNLFKYHSTENPEPLFKSDTLFYLFKYGIQVMILAYSSWLLYILRKSSRFFEIGILLLSTTILFITPAGATYHNLLLLLPLCLFARIGNKADNRYRNFWSILLGCVVLGGILPLVQNRITSFSFILPFAFYRLWLLGIFYFTITYWLLKSHKKNYWEASV